jgi:hypothetical protein
MGRPRGKVYGFGINDADYDTQPRVNGKQVACEFFRRWKHMLSRCYQEKSLTKHPTYIGCSVCPEWLIFSNFKRWMEQQDWRGLELDKDIIKPFNKVYCPDFCRFIPRYLNSLLTNCMKNKGKYSLGVTWQKADKKYRAKICDNGKRRCLGLHETNELAASAYIKAKVIIILNIAKSQEDLAIKNGLMLHAEIIQKGIGNE